MGDYLLFALCILVTELIFLAGVAIGVVLRGARVRIGWTRTQTEKLPRAGGIDPGESML